jgi:hypothetical protein
VIDHRSALIDKAKEKAMELWNIRSK